MISRCLDAAQSVVPNAIQYPPKRWSKFYKNNINRRKLYVTNTRFVFELLGAIFAMMLLWIIPGFEHFAYGFVLNELIDSQFAAAFTTHFIMFFVGFAFGSFTTKQAFRVYHHFKYHVSNSDYIKLSDAEIQSLKETRHIEPKDAMAIFNYLTYEIQQAKNDARKNHSLTSPCQQIKVSNKLALETFREAAKKPDIEDLIYFVTFCSQEVARLDTCILALQNQNSDLKKLKKDTPSKSDVKPKDSIDSEEKSNDVVIEMIDPKEKIPADRSHKLIHKTASFWYESRKNYHNLIIKHNDNEIKKLQEKQEKL